MAIQGQVTINVTLTGDVDFADTFSTAKNLVSPGQIEVQDLSSGNNTVTVATAGGSTAVGVVILPPAANTIVLTLKGVNGDTGFVIHPTDPTYIGLGSAVANFVISAGSAITGVRFIFV